MVAKSGSFTSSGSDDFKFRLFYQILIVVFVSCYPFFLFKNITLVTCILFDIFYVRKVLFDNEKPLNDIKTFRWT